ncbi:MAG: hypothetical protein ACE5JF_01785 [Anaerolineales bacterium]
MATGLLLGLGGLAAAYLLRLVVPGRLLADPLPLALMPAALMSSLREGFTYFDLRSPALHLFFATSIGAAAAWVIVRLGRTPEQARQTARIALGLSVLAAAVQEVDAVVVAFYYGLSAFVSLSISAVVADRVTRRLLRRLPTVMSRGR